MLHQVPRFTADVDVLIEESEDNYCGLGLTIAQWIVHAHGGNIQLIPESNDQVSVVVRILVDATTTGRSRDQRPADTCRAIFFSDFDMNARHAAESVPISPRSPSRQ